jgi:two-component system, chemotaxis family, sensor kinase CheA
MNNKQEEFLAIITGLLELEKDQTQEDRQNLVEVTFREVHSLKGASRAVNLLDVERLCQSIESVFSLLKQQLIIPTKYFFNILHSAMNLLEQYLNDISTQQKTVNADRAVHIINDIQGLCKGLESVSPAKKDPIIEEQTISPISDTNPSNSYKPVSFPKKNEAESNIYKSQLNEIKVPEPQSTEKNPALIDIGGSKDTVRISTAKLTELLIQADYF